MADFDVELLEEAVQFLRTLPVKLRAKAFRGIDLLQELGPELPMPHARQLKQCDGLYELRVKFASDIVRLFYFRHQAKLYIVTSGFVKKANKMDPIELRRAIRLMREYKESLR